MSRQRHKNGVRNRERRITYSANHNLFYYFFRNLSKLFYSISLHFWVFRYFFSSNLSLALRKFVFNTADLINKTISEQINSLFYRVSKIFARSFKKLGLRLEETLRVDAKNKSADQERSNAGFQERSFEKWENIFNLANWTFIWTKWYFKIKALKTSKEKKEGLSNAVLYGFEISQLPFLIMQTIQDLWFTINGFDISENNLFKKLEKFVGSFNKLKAILWVFTAVSYFNNIIILVKTALDLFYTKKQSARNRLLKELIKSVISASLSIVMAVVMITFFRAGITTASKEEMKKFKAIREFILGLILFSESLFKNFPYLLGWSRDRIIDLWRKINGTYVEKSSTIEANKLLNWWNKCILRLESFLHQFTRDQENYLKLNLLEKNKITGMDWFNFSLNGLLITASLTATAFETSAVLFPFASISLIVMSSLVILSSIILLIDSFRKYFAANSDEERSVAKDNGIVQVTKIILAALIMVLIFGLSTSSIGIVATIASVVFYSYTLLNRKFSEKSINEVAVLPQFSTSEAILECQFTNNQLKHNVLYLYLMNETELLDSAERISNRTVLKGAIYKNGKLQTLIIDRAKFDEEDLILLDQTIIGKMPLSNALISKIFIESSKEGVYAKGTTLQATWPKYIRTFFTWIKNNLSSLFSKEIPNPNPPLTVNANPIEVNTLLEPEPQNHIEKIETKWQKGELKKGSDNFKEPLIRLSKARDRFLFNKKLPEPLSNIIPELKIDSNVTQNTPITPNHLELSADSVVPESSPSPSLDKNVEIIVEPLKQTEKISCSPITLFKQGLNEELNRNLLVSSSPIPSN